MGFKQGKLRSLKSLNNLSVTPSSSRILFSMSDSEISIGETQRNASDCDISEKWDYDTVAELRHTCKALLEGINRRPGEDRANHLHNYAGLLCSIALGQSVGPIGRDSYPPTLPFNDKNAASDHNGPFLDPVFIIRALQAAVDDTSEDSPELGFRQDTLDAAFEYLARSVNPIILIVLQLLQAARCSNECSTRCHSLASQHLPNAFHSLFDEDIPFDHMDLLLCVDLCDPRKKSLPGRQYLLGEWCLSHFQTNNEPKLLENAIEFLRLAAYHTPVPDSFDVDVCRRRLDEAHALNSTLYPNTPVPLTYDERVALGIECHHLFATSRKERHISAAVSILSQASRDPSAVARDVKYSLGQALLDYYKFTSTPSMLNEALVTLQSALDSTTPGTAEFNIRQQCLQDGYLLAFSIPPPDITGAVTKTGEQPLASGGFGDVWQGQLVSDFTTRKVAIKVVRKAWDDEEVFTKRFRRELGIWHHLSRSHANVLPLLGVCSGFGPTLSMVSPWFNRGNLYNLIKEEHETLPISERLDIMWGIACGLQHLHMYNLMHGDLSSCNVLIQDDGVPCLADFGLSRVLFDASETIPESSALNKISDGNINIIKNSPDSTIGGSLRYSAPEMWAFDGDHPVDPIKRVSTRTDVYSFGSLMLEVLTGQIPYHDLRNDGQVLLKVYAGTPPSAPAGANITPEQWDVIQSCWMRDPALRPAARKVASTVARLPRDFEDKDDIFRNSLRSMGWTATRDGGLARVIGDETYMEDVESYARLVGLVV